MESKNTTLRKLLEPRIFRYHLKRFFKVSNFVSGYIALETKIGDNESVRESLGEYVCINTNNSGEITNYIDYIIDQYKKLIILKKINITFIKYL